MANKKENHQPISNKVKITVPNPDSFPLTAVHVGGIATWKSSTSKYPKFQISFAESNPFNRRKHAKFNGSNTQPVTLEVKSSGTFKYTIKHIPPDGKARVTGPFALSVPIATDGIRKPPPPPGPCTCL